MLTLMTLNGSYFSEKRHQINKVNYYAEKITNYHRSNPEKAREYASKLLNYYQKLSNEDRTALEVEQWFIENLPSEIIRKIDNIISNNRLREHVFNISASARLPDIYTQYEDKDSFRTLIQNRLQRIDKDFKVVSLSSGNNPVVRVNHKDKRFIIRFLRMNRVEETQGHSPRIARELLDGIQQIPKPYLLEQVEEDSLEVTFMEYSEYFENGNLKDYFEQLRLQKQKKLITSADFDKMILIYAKKMVDFFTAINQKNIWYTDLKPSNILLNNNDELVISDIKGLTISLNTMVHSSRTNTSQQYFQSTVFVRNQIDLELLQCQTLGTTLYQLATGHLPEQLEMNTGMWKNIYNFKQPVFEGVTGVFLKHLISHLISPVALPMNTILTQLAPLLLAEEALKEDTDVSLDDSLLDLQPSTETERYFGSSKY